MAITRIMEYPPVPPDTLTFGFQTGTLVLGLIWLGFFACFAFFLLSLSQQRKAVSREAVVQGMPVTEPPPFAGPEHAAAVSYFANRHYYQSLLAALQDALLSEGYEMTTDGTRCLPLPPGTAERVARDVAFAREKHLLPLQSDDRMEAKLAEDRKNGYAARWLECLIAGSASQGWYIARRQGADGTEATYSTPSWDAFAYPLKQVIVTVTAPATTLTRDRVRCLSDAVRIVRDEPFPVTADGLVCSGVADTDTLQYVVRRRLCHDGPGFFLGAAGSDVPAHLSLSLHEPAPPGTRQFTVFVQGTRHTPPQVLAHYIEEAGRLIAAGLQSGAMYDDDSGYAFVLRAADLFDENF